MANSYLRETKGQLYQNNIIEYIIIYVKKQQKSNEMKLSKLRKICCLQRISQTKKVSYLKEDEEGKPK